MSTASPQLDQEAEYNVRLLHPDREKFYARWGEESARAYRELPCTRDVRYGPGDRAALDLFPPLDGARGRGVPLVAFFHGGYWQAHARGEFAFVARAFASAGIATAVVGYDLAPAARFGSIVAQARAACAWLQSNAGELGFDGELVFPAGHSAGAHLAACILTGGEHAAAGGVLVSGIFELSPLLRTTLNQALALTAASARRWSPVHHRLPAGGNVLLAVGAFETTGFIQQSYGFARHWHGEGRSAEAMVVPATHHYDIVLELADADSALSRAARHLVARTAASFERRRRGRRR